MRIGLQIWRLLRAALNENFIALGFRENERKVGCKIGHVEKF
jgi:hypothetical protein